MTMSTVAPPDEDMQVPVPELLGRLLDLNGSDLHLTAGTPPTVRIHGELERLEDYPPLAPRSLQGMIYVVVDANSSGSIASIRTSGSGKIPGGIHVNGTLAFHVVNAPSSSYPLSIETPLYVNAVIEGWRIPPLTPQRYGVTAAKDVEWLARRLVPQPIKTFEQSLESAFIRAMEEAA